MNLDSRYLGDKAWSPTELLYLLLCRHHVMYLGLLDVKTLIRGIVTVAMLP